MGSQDANVIIPKVPPNDGNLQLGWRPTGLGEASDFMDKENKSQESPWSVPALIAEEGQSQDATTELNGQL